MTSEEQGGRRSCTKISNGSCKRCDGGSVTSHHVVWDARGPTLKSSILTAAHERIQIAAARIAASFSALIMPIGSTSSSPSPDKDMISASNRLYRGLQHVNVLPAIDQLPFARVDHNENLKLDLCIGVCCECEQQPGL